jgi:RNA polymerase sigma-70 factor (ECF subfamily)
MKGGIILEDRDIIKRYLAGQMDIIDILVDKYKNPLYKLCHHLAREGPDADDLFQETWIRAIKRVRLYDSDKPFLPWLCAICTNLYRDNYRMRKRWLSRVREYFSGEEKEADMESAGNQSPLLEDELMEKLDRECVRRFVDKLDDMYRLPVILYYFKEIDYADIASVLNIPMGTVKSRLYGAKQRLRKLMEVEQYGQ